MKESVIGVIPTGSGKSLTYQLPALIDAEKTKSITIVIEPLVALTQDQVNILKSRYQIPNVEYISSLQNIQGYYSGCLGCRLCLGS
ncbi:MAG: ATP-dependent DNA helicase RecQ [candidate division WS2 bacterium]|uniref:ATP-dependent DNA helicase RecQ n=1 Tax=Psychracetigena formicireducens TaxID=2986056 RepID=A0A9E2BIC3_PSYF1|nr:ATP-dependent DNA helicase RecQ [Candidatus Psychracetigena formicireducens]MBT9145402.1 ATP-dependent DNA helicase RecQ [Candidatus Psychracetigena formicireducens]